jgi:oligosaccharyltransferase complex subunit gamma
VELYDDIGAITSDAYPTFFAQMTYSNEIVYIYEQFGFKGAPNLAVSKPQMAVVSEIEKKIYLQQFKWSISHTDGHVTTHKMLEFVNKRTGKEVFYKPPLLTMLQMFFGFISVALIGVYVYTRLRAIWNHWLFWLIGSLVTLTLSRLCTSPVAPA